MVDIYRDTKRRGIYPPLFTDPLVFTNYFVMDENNFVTDKNNFVMDQKEFSHG